MGPSKDPNFISKSLYKCSYLSKLSGIIMQIDVDYSIETLYNVPNFGLI
jgi:hypothetical protein